MYKARNLSITLTGPIYVSKKLIFIYRFEGGVHIYNTTKLNYNMQLIKYVLLFN
jgi:hypothetical protein